MTRLETFWGAATAANDHCHAAQSDQPLSRIIYVSRATCRVEAEGINAILTTARHNNISLGITGVLAFQDGGFLQVLEGPEPEVQGLFTRILADRRHESVILVERAAISERVFSGWAMGWIEDRDRLSTGFDIGMVRSSEPSGAMIRAMLAAFSKVGGHAARPARVG